ncbi:MAG TPA: class I SAM-dependent methyltransferase [Pyrinomonadaceae bacterium]|jgi:SAM-dependent methyltransferase
MIHNQEQVLEYWNNDEVESMYDKNLLKAEIDLIEQYIPPSAKILDAGCGEGEGTLAYAAVPGAVVHAVDFSETRLQKARSRLSGRENVIFKQVDFLGTYDLDSDYDVIISQRFLINLMEWSLQQKVLLDLTSRLKPGGRLLMLEGSRQGVDSLNEFRAAFGLEPLQVKWHNLFFDDCSLVDFMTRLGHDLVHESGLGAYFLLTRGIRPMLDKTLDWDCEFNRLAAAAKTDELLELGARFSRLKLWVFQKPPATLA